MGRDRPWQWRQRSLYWSNLVYIILYNYMKWSEDLCSCYISIQAQMKGFFLRPPSACVRGHAVTADDGRWCAMDGFSHGSLGWQIPRLPAGFCRARWPPLWPRPQRPVIPVFWPKMNVPVPQERSADGVLLPTAVAFVKIGAGPQRSIAFCAIHRRNAQQPIVPNWQMPVTVQQLLVVLGTWVSECA